MPQERSLEARLSAVERTIGSVTASDGSSVGQACEESRDLAVGGQHDAGGTDISARIEDLEARVTELEAGLQAIRGYVGNVDHVNQSVERRANAAIAAVERLESAPDTQPALADVPEAAVGSDRPDESGSSGPAAPTNAASQTPDSEEEGIFERVTARL